MIERTKLLVTMGASIATGIIAMTSWYFLVVLLMNGAIVLPTIGGMNFTEIIVSVRPYTPAELQGKMLLLLGVFPIPGVLGFYMFFTIGAIGFLIPWAIVSGKIFKELEDLRHQVFEVLQLASAYARTGVSLPEALMNISEAVGPPLGPRIKSYAMLIRVHIISPLDAFNKVFGDLPRDIRTLLGIIHIAVRGGRPSDVIKAAASLASNIRRFEETRMSRLSGTNAVIFVAVLAYVVTSIIMTRLMDIIASVSQEATATGGASLFTITMPIEHIMVIYYLSSLILAVLGGIMLARVVKGSTIIALKYHLMLFIIIFLCFLFLPPLLSTIL